MSEPTNKDGLVPGQIVDYETMKRVEQARKNRKPEPVKRGRGKTEKQQGDE